jgi:hypothetical protein
MASIKKLYCKEPKAVLLQNVCDCHLGICVKCVSVSSYFQLFKSSGLCIPNLQKILCRVISVFVKVGSESGNKSEK